MSCARLAAFPRAGGCHGSWRRWGWGSGTPSQVQRIDKVDLLCYKPMILVTISSVTRSWKQRGERKAMKACGCVGNLHAGIPCRVEHCNQDHGFITKQVHFVNPLHLARCALPHPQRLQDRDSRPPWEMPQALPHDITRPLLRWPGDNRHGHQSAVASVRRYHVGYDPPASHSA